MSSSPKVTICIPTYNYGHFIGQAIKSVLRQEFSDYELLVLDNDSNDMTKEVVKQYSDARINYIKNGVNLGFVANINKGLALSRGENIIYLCADDVWYGEILRKEVALLDNNRNLSFVHTAEKWIDPQGKVVGINRCRWKPMTSGTEAFKEFFRLGWNISFSSCMMRRSLLKKIGGFHPEFGNITDSGAFLMLFLEGDAAFIDAYHVGYRFVHSDSLTKESLPDGNIFIAQKKLLDNAFDWEKVKAKDLQKYKQRTLFYLAQQTVTYTNIIKIVGGNRGVLRCFKEAFVIYPGIVFSPLVWMRVSLSLILPKKVIKWLRKIKTKVTVSKDTLHNSNVKYNKYA